MVQDCITVVTANLIILLNYLVERNENTSSLIAISDRPNACENYVYHYNGGG
jgi:hypothetical protein